MEQKLETKKTEEQKYCEALNDIKAADEIIHLVAQFDPIYSSSPWSVAGRPALIDAGAVAALKLAGKLKGLGFADKEKVADSATADKQKIEELQLLVLELLSGIHHFFEGDLSKQDIRELSKHVSAKYHRVNLQN